VEDFFFDVGSHTFDLLDFLLGPVGSVTGAALNSSPDIYSVEDVVSASFIIEQANGNSVIGSGLWNFNADVDHDEVIISGNKGHARFSIFEKNNNVLMEWWDGNERKTETIEFDSVDFVHEHLIRNIVEELTDPLGRQLCLSTGAAAARTSWVLEQCVRDFTGSEL